MTYSAFLSCIKKASPQMGFDYVYRKVSHPISYALFVHGFSPNIVSVASILLTIISGFILVYISPIWGLVAFMFAYLLDFCDGNIARAIMCSSSNSRESQDRVFGMILENLNTNISATVFFLSLGWYLFTQSNNVLPILIAAILVAITLIFRYLKIHYQALRFTNDVVASEVIFRNAFFIKNFLSKSLFNISSYYPLFLILFILFPVHVNLVFVVYSLSVIIYTLIRATVFLWKIYPIKSSH